jgi:hypothetical protein
VQAVSGAVVVKVVVVVKGMVLVKPAKEVALRK